MKRAMLTAMIASLACVCTLHAQGTAQPRRILFDTFVPIAARILPGDQRIKVISASPLPLVVHTPAEEFVARLVRRYPIIFTGRTLEKQPVFMRLRAGEKYSEVPSIEANWIGSRVTVMVDRIIQTADEFPLTILQRLTFIEDGDGTATINGVRIDTETPWLEPIQQGRRYLIAGQMVGGEFSPIYLWMEPPDGGNMRPRLRDTSPIRPKALFDDWKVEEASHSIEAEVQRRRNGH